MLTFEANLTVPEFSLLRHKTLKATAQFVQDLANEDVE